MIFPGILTDSLQQFDFQLSQVKDFAENIHIDIMDGLFVENKSFDFFLLESLPSNINFEVHLMVEDPKKYLDHADKIGIKTIIVHIEALDNPKKFIEYVKREYNFGIGIALNPETKMSVIEEIVEDIDFVLLMSVHPGKQGQEYIQKTNERVQAIKARHKTLLIKVDGGINDSVLIELKKIGVEDFVIGSRLFQSLDVKKAYTNFTNL